MEKTNKDRLEAFLSKKQTDIDQIANRMTVEVNVKSVSETEILINLDNNDESTRPPSKLFIGKRLVRANVNDEVKNNESP